MASKIRDMARLHGKGCELDKTRLVMALTRLWSELGAQILADHNRGWLSDFSVVERVRDSGAREVHHVALMAAFGCHREFGHPFGDNRVLLEDRNAVGFDAVSHGDRPAHVRIHSAIGERWREGKRRKDVFLLT